jgi:hypothetical protein
MWSQYDTLRPFNFANCIVRKGYVTAAELGPSGGNLSASKKSSHVPSQYYGYSLQCTHCIYLLLDAPPDSKVSVEVLEDVAVGDLLDEVHAVQVKSALKTNPIGNRSVELWKTIANWIRALESGELELDKTIFSLRLGRKRNGRICESFAEAASFQTAHSAIEKARVEFFTRAGKIKNDVPEKLREIIETVFDPARVGLLEKLIVRFRLSVGTGYAYEELLTHVKSKLFDDDVAEDVLLRALGWVKKEIDNAVERDLPPFVAVNEFRTEISAFHHRLEARRYLPSFAGPPSLEEVELHKLRVFVRQLNFVKFSDEQVLRGITDFLSAKANVVEYARRGYVHEKSFLEFKDALRSLWQNHHDEIELDQARDEVARGKLLALRCLREKLNLQGIDVPADFVRGSFHSLADEPCIGWHPRYETLLDGEASDAGS